MFPQHTEIGFLYVTKKSFILDLKRQIQFPGNLSKEKKSVPYLNIA